MYQTDSNQFKYIGTEFKSIRIELQPKIEVKYEYDGNKFCPKLGPYSQSLLRKYLAAQK